MKIIGLCGGSGSGKGTICSRFLSHGIPSIDADRVYREIAVPGSAILSDLAREFGKDVLTEDGSLNRSVLSHKAFGADADPNAKDRLNRITHARIIEETERRIHELEDRCDFVIFDAPLLFESGFDKRCDIIIAVVADTDIRAKRIMERDGIAMEAALARISAQLPDAVLIERADYVITNNGSATELDDAVCSIVEKLKKNK